MPEKITMSGPKLEIVRDGDLIELYVNGKCVDGGITESAAMTAAAVAEALGAEVVNADEPSRQLYTYFVAYIGTRPSGAWSPGFIWCTRPTEINSFAETDEVITAIRANDPGFSGVVITNFICTDGPF